MALDTLIFDLDDTLYSPTTGVWDAIGERINQFIVDNLALDGAEVKQVRDELFHTYGTTLRGLQIVYGIDPYKYLNFVHNIPLETYLRPNPMLNRMLKQISNRKVIFTNSDQNHALRVLDRLGLDGIFERIIDVMDVTPFCKPQPEAFQQALKLLGNPDPTRCVLIDDSLRNINTASELGFHTILVGNHNGNAHSASARVDTLEDLPLLADLPFLQGIWRPE
ncbi:MAG: pyrimidine 5'-nucleotidase [Chloroflexi bacterium]|nr:MAG: pyrimidine 5'-nucleotidase [Chloroflexota bacterium]